MIKFITITIGMPKKPQNPQILQSSPSTRLTIGIFGGSFNPPHLGHLLASQQLIDFEFVNQVWLMPCFAHVWGKKLAPAKDRLRMCRFLENRKVKVSTLETDQKKALPTIATLKLLEKKYPQHEFAWIIGEKSLSELPKWDHYQELLKNYRFLIIPQTPLPSDSSAEVSTKVEALAKESQKNKFNQLSTINYQQLKVISRPLWVTTNLSSSIIRQRIKKDLSVSGFVPPRVGEYIKENKLYKGTSVR